MAVDRRPTFLDLLKESGLLEPEQLDELLASPDGQSGDPSAAARFALRRGWLTKFQLQQINQGKAGELTLGSYRLLDRLGEGGMGTVYKAHHQVMNRVVALKVIRRERLARPDAVKRFYREIQVAAQLVHPNIVVAYDAGQAASGPAGSKGPATHFFAMEYVDGVDLARVVREKGPLPVPTACEYVRQAALGLQHAFERGLVHRDIKPHNLLLTRPATLSGPGSSAAGKPDKGDVVKILDMGLALSGDNDTAMTREGAVLGTPEYLSPEQAMNSRAADTRSDIYSLGCTFHYLLTGRAPFASETLTEMLLKHQMHPPTPVPGLAPGVQEILDRMLAKRPEDRYQTPAEAVEALIPFASATAGTPGAVPSVGRPGAAAPRAEVTESMFDFSAQSTPSGSQTGLIDDPAGEPAKSVGRGNRGSSRAAVMIGGAAGLGIAALLAAGLISGLPGHRKTDPSESHGVPPADPPAMASTDPHPGTQPRPPIPSANPPDPGAPQPPAPPTPPGPPPPPAPPDAPARGPVGVGQPPAGPSNFDRLDPSAIPAEDRVPGCPDVVAVLNGGKTDLGSLAVAPDGQHIAAGSAIGQLLLWNLADGPPKFLGSLTTQGAVTALAFAPNSRTIAAGMSSNVCQVWDITRAQTARKRATLEGHAPGYQTVTFAPAGLTALVADAGKIHVWDLTGREPRETGSIPTFTSTARALSLSADGGRLVTVDQPTNVQLRAMTPDGTPLRVHGFGSDPRGALTCAAVSPDNRFMALGSAEGVVNVWVLNGAVEPPPLRSFPQIRPAIKAHEGPVVTLAYAPDGSLFTFGQDQKIGWWNTDGSRIKEWQLPARLSRGAVTSDGRHVVAAAHNGNVYILRTRPEDRLAVRPPPEPPAQPPVTPPLPPTTPPPAAMARPPAARQPVPDDAAQEKALALVKDLFKDEYAKKKPADVIALATKLSQQAAETKDDPAGRFILLREARDLAAQGGDFALAFKVVDDMDAAFAVDPVEYKLAALAAGARAAGPVTLKPVLEAYFSLVDQEVGADRYDEALKITALAEAAAHKTGGPALTAWADARAKVVRDLAKEFAGIQPALKTLEATPEDPAANLAVGVFYCLRKGDWDKGLPRLSKGGDETLKAPALKDLGEPAEVAGQIEVGDAWWNKAQAETGPAKTAFLRRAYHWYTLAAPAASGLNLKRIDDRIKKLELIPELKSASELVGLVRTLRGHTDEVLCVSVSKDGRHAVSGSRDATARAWDLESGKELHRFTPPEFRQSAVTAATYSPDGQLVALGEQNGTCQIWDPSTNQRRTSFPTNSSVDGLAFVADGNRVAFSSGPVVWVWPFMGGGNPKALGSRGSPVTAVAVGRSAVGEICAFGCTDGAIHFADVDSGRTLTTGLRGHPAKILSLAMTRDTRTLVSSGADKTVRVWDPRTGQLVLMFKGPTGQVNGLALSRDGRRLVTAGEDASVRVWDVRTGAMLAKLTGHDGPVRAVAISPDGHRAVSAGSDKTVKLWNLPR